MRNWANEKGQQQKNDKISFNIIALFYIQLFTRNNHNSQRLLWKRSFDEEKKQAICNSIYGLIISLLTILQKYILYKLYTISCCKWNWLSQCDKSLVWSDSWKLCPGKMSSRINIAMCHTKCILCLVIQGFSPKV